MEFPHGKKPITQLFREAAKSCNEWRDTLYYTGLFALGIASTQWNIGISPQTLLFMAGQREMFRYLAWSKPGGFNFKHCNSSAFGFTNLWVLENVVRGVANHNLVGYMSGSGGIDTLLLLGGSALAYVCAGGVKNIYNDYKDTLFDYPRKKNPPQKPHKNKSIEKLKEAWRDLKDKIAGPAPEGAMQPIPIPVKRDALQPAC